MIQILVVALAVVGLIAARRRRRSRLPARAAIVSPPRSTVISSDGAVRSVQSAELTLPRGELDRMWNAPNLENLGRTYWRFLSRVTLGLIRVAYGANERRVFFLARPFTLLRFDAPEYTLEPDHGTIKWRIRDGLLVSRGGRGCGFLAIDVDFNRRIIERLAVLQVAQVGKPRELFADFFGMLPALAKVRAAYRDVDWRRRAKAHYLVDDVGWLEARSHAGQVGRELVAKRVFQLFDVDIRTLFECDIENRLLRSARPLIHGVDRKIAVDHADIAERNSDIFAAHRFADDLQAVGPHR